MNAPTAEQARAAAETLTAYATKWLVGGTNLRPEGCRLSADELLLYANRVDKEQAEKAKRDKRIEEIAELLFVADGNLGLIRWSECESGSREDYIKMATAMIDCYPSLLDEDGEQ